MAVPTMSRETLFTVCGLGGVVVTAALAGYLLGVPVGLGVGVVGAAAVGLYRHISHLRDQQKALEQQVEQQQEKTTSYRRQFEKTQNQLQEVKDEISTATEDSSESTDSAAQPSTTEPEPTTATEVAQSAAAIQQSDSETTATEAEPPAPTETRGAAETPTNTPAPSTTRPPSLAAVVEQSWKTVDTHSVVLEIVDSQPLQAEAERLESTLRDLIRAVIAEQTGDRQVFTSRAIALRAQHRNPQSDVTIQNDGGDTPQREAPGRRVVRVGTTENGIYVDCTAALADGNGKQEARLEAVQRQIRDYGWSLSVSKHGDGHRIEIDQTTAPQRRPA